MGERTSLHVISEWQQYDRYCRNFTTGIEYDLWDTEYNLYRKMQAMERVPTIKYGQPTLADVVFAFNHEIDRRLMQGTLAGKTFIFSLEGLPGAGKDYTGEKYVIPAIKTHLDRLRIRDPSIPTLDILSWDKTQDELRAEGNHYRTPSGGASTPDELVLTQKTLESEINQIIRRNPQWREEGMIQQNEKSCQVMVVKLLTGTALREPDGEWFEEPRKIYGDYILENLMRRRSVFRDIPPDDVIVSRVALELGPWMQIWHYYRWIILQTKSKEEADIYNLLFHLPRFPSENEWRMLKEWKGGDPQTIAKAIRVANVTKDRMKRFGRVLSPDIPDIIFQDIHTVSDLLGVDYESVKEVALTLLGHAMVHENNIRLSGVAEYLSAVIYNNPRIQLTPEELVNLWAILKDLVIDEKNAAWGMERK